MHKLTITVSDENYIQIKRILDEYEKIYYSDEIISDDDTPILKKLKGILKGNKQSLSEIRDERLKEKYGDIY